MLWLCILCSVLSLSVIVLLIKRMLDHKALREIQTQMDAKLEQDTNTLISISSQDRHLKCLANALNIQLRKLREERRKLQHGDQALKEAITNISHDLRTPLTAICGYMDLLSREDLPQAANDYLAIISNRVEALKALTEELLQYAIASGSNAYAIREAVSLNHAIEACAAAYYGALKERKIDPQIILPDSIINRELNQAALSRILGNIMSNALRYSDGDLQITLSENAEITFSNHAASLDDV
ncbi:MAG: HAMP domain-containing sensor histidine kinase, partial [Clostridia bacterium]